MPKEARPDPKLLKGHCFKCGSKLIATADEEHRTSGKGTGSGWTYKAASGKPVRHRIWKCPQCRLTREVDGEPKGDLP